MNRLLQRFVADQDDSGGGDWASQRVQEAHASPFAVPAPSPSPSPAFEDIPLSSSTTGAKYDTVDLFDDGKKSSAAFPPAPPPPAAPAASEEPLHDFFGGSQSAHDRFGSAAHTPQHDPFAASPVQQHSPFASAPDSHEHSPFGSSSEQQHSPFGSSTSHQHSPFAAAQEQQHSPFGSSTSHQHSPFAAAQEQHPSPFGAAAEHNDPFSSAPKPAQSSFGSSALADQSSPFGLASEQPSPFGSASEHQANPFGAAPDSQSSPFSPASEQQHDPFAATTGQQSHDPFAATPEAYSQTQEQQYYQGHDQYTQHQYDSNGYDYYQQHDQQQYYDQYQQQQYGGEQGYGGQYQYSAEEYQYYQSQNGQHTEDAASAFGQQYHQQGYEYPEAPVGAEGSVATPTPEEPAPSADSFFSSTVQPPVSSGSPFDQPPSHTGSATDPFAQSPAHATDYFHHEQQQQQHAAFSHDSTVSAPVVAEENQSGSEVLAPVQDFFSNGNSSPADASSLFSAPTPTEEAYSDSYFGSSQSASAPSPVSQHVQSPAPVAIPHVPAAEPVNVEDKASQLQGAFASLGISTPEGENPADHPEQSSERTTKPKSRATSTTLDDTIRLAEMYKQMAERLQTEKNDLLKVLADQTDQFYQMQDYIRSLEREVEEYRSKELGA